jgi:hypothetical protein
VSRVGDGVGEEGVDQGDDLEGLPQAHAVRQDAPGSRFFLEDGDALVASLPHELHSSLLVGFEHRGQLGAHGDQRLSSLDVGVQDEVLVLGPDRLDLQQLVSTFCT